MHNDCWPHGVAIARAYGNQVAVSIDERTPRPISASRDELTMPDALDVRVGE